MKAKQKHTRFAKGKQLLRRRVKLLLVPHHANQYRPHLIRRYGLTALLVMVVAIQGVYNFSITGSVLGMKTSTTTQSLLDDANAERAKSQLPPLTLNNQLSQAAAMKARDMFKQQYWAHVAPDGTTPWHWFNVVHYGYAAAGENLAKNFTTADAATVAWMASPEHRANILGNYKDVGFAVASGTLDGKPASIIVALFGEPTGTPMAAASTTVDAPRTQVMSPMARVGVALESLTPAAIASLFILTIAVAVALTAHFYRRKLPKALRKSWYRHHGLLKVGGMLSFALMMLFLYSGGQI